MAAPFLGTNAKTLFELIPEIGEQRGSIDSIIDERYPHISKRILAIWGSRECMEYLQSLIEFNPSKDRPSREGFPFHALIELNIIREVHHRDFPYSDTHHAIRLNDPWNVRSEDGK